MSTKKKKNKNSSLNRENETNKKNNEIINKNNNLRNEILTLCFQIEKYIKDEQNILSKNNNDKQKLLTNKPKTPSTKSNKNTPSNQNNQSSSEYNYSMGNILDDLPAQQQISLYQESIKNVKISLNNYDEKEFEIKKIENKIKAKKEELYNILSEKKS